MTGPECCCCSPDALLAELGRHVLRVRTIVEQRRSCGPLDPMESTGVAVLLDQVDDIRRALVDS